MQSKKRSLLESIVAVIIGMAYAIPLNYVMINHMTWPSALMQSVCITVAFTAISLTLKYVLRRTFNWIDVRYPTAHFSTLDLSARSANLGTIDAGFISTADGSMTFDFTNRRVVLDTDKFTPSPKKPKEWYIGQTIETYVTFNEDGSVEVFGKEYL